MTSCSRCGTGNPPVARFCMACGGPVDAGPPGAAQSRAGLRFVTVAFCDISGSTQLAARLSPEVWHAALEYYFAEVGGVLERHGGRLEKFIGDAVVGVFGADDPADDDAPRAVRAALAALQRVGAGNPALAGHGVQLSVRFGIASGQVVLSERDSSFAIGAVMNRAARLQSAAAADRALVDLRTWLLVRDRLACRPVAPVVAKGFDAPLQAWEPDTAPATTESGLFINQRALLRTLTRELDARLARPGCSALVVHGEIGIGKTALLRQLARPARQAGALLLGVECGRDDRDQGLWRLLQLDRQVREAAGLPGPGSGPAPSAPELQWRVLHTLGELAAGRPVVVALDNAQWMPDSVRQLVLRGTPGPGTVVFVLAGRELPEGVAGRVPAFPVPALSPEHSHALLDRLDAELPTGDLELHLVRAEELVRRSGGNPLFLEQLLALARDGVDDLVAPSASAALGARIDRLGTDARQVLACAGAFGPDVGTAHLAAGTGLEADRLAAALGELERAGLPPASGSAAQVAYAHLPLAERARLHDGIARHWGRQVGALPSAVEPAALHAVRALACLREISPGSAEEVAARSFAAQCLLAAARDAVARSEVRRAVELTEQATELSGNDTALRLELAALGSYAEAASGRADQALARIDEVRARVPDAERVNPAASFQLRANELALRPGPGAELAAASLLAERLGDGAASARLLLLQGLDRFREGRYPDAERLFGRAHGALRTGGTAGRGLGTAEVYANLSLCLAYGDGPAGQAAARCLELRAEVADAPALHALVGCAAALVLRSLGDAGQAAALLDEAESVFTGLGHTAGLLGLRQFRASVAEFGGDGPGAAAELLRAAELADRVGVPSARLRAAAWLLDPDRAAQPQLPRPGPESGWEAQVLEHQFRALAADCPEPAAELGRALCAIEDVRGDGAVLLPLAACLRLSRRTGAREPEARAGALLTAATARREAVRPVA